MIREEKSCIWQIKGRKVLNLSPFFVVGIVNTTPDSFYDGGKYINEDTAFEHGKQLLLDGANCLDIGGESSRPFSEHVSVEEEERRVLGLIKRFRENFPESILSIDTYKAIVAKKSLEIGADIINDISAFSFDKNMLEVLLEHEPGYVLMHNTGRAENKSNNWLHNDIIEDLKSFFEKKILELTKLGFPEENIVLDPGIGFGKNLADNLTILKRIDELKIFSRPLYMGLSNKSLWSDLLAVEKEQRLLPTVVSTVLLASNNIQIHRVHQVKEIQEALKILSNIKG